MKACHLAASLVFSLLAASSRTGLAESPILVKKKVDGNYELECVVGKAPWGFLLFFSADEKLSEYGYLKVSASAIELGHHHKGRSVTWRRYKPRSGSCRGRCGCSRKETFSAFGWVTGPAGFAVPAASGLRSTNRERAGSASRLPVRQSCVR